MLLLSFAKCKVLLDSYGEKRERNKKPKLQIIVNIVGIIFLSASDQLFWTLSSNLLLPLARMS